MNHSSLAGQLYMYFFFLWFFGFWPTGKIRLAHEIRITSCQQTTIEHNAIFTQCVSN